MIIEQEYIVRTKSSEIGVACIVQQAGERACGRALEKTIGEAFDKAHARYVENLSGLQTEDLSGE